MRNIRVYVDTSVFGGTEDEEFSAPSRQFFERVHRGEFEVLVSQITVDELAGAPATVQRVLKEIPDESLILVSANQESAALAEAYVDAGILGPSSLADALHVATATVAGADLILSWNFRHIVNYDRIRRYHGVNALKGDPPIEIHSPLEMSNVDENQEF
jgi:predicted nucleic acid-binding protein